MEVRSVTYPTLSGRWKFSAETSTTLLIELLVALFAVRKTQTCWDAVLILSLFPLSVAMIAGLEAMGFD